MGRALAVVIAGLLGALVTFDALGLRVNLAQSMPMGLYRLTPCGEGVGAALRLGDLVAVDSGVAARSNAGVRFFWERRYLTFTGSARDLLLKEVAGLGGDVVEEADGRLRIAGRAQSAVASFRSKRAGGEALPRLPFPYRVPQDELWLRSEHRRGIDSRYFGGVPVDSVACRAEALWTR